MYTDNNKRKSVAPAGNNQCSYQKSISTDNELLSHFFFLRKRVL